MGKYIPCSECFRALYFHNKQAAKLWLEFVEAYDDDCYCFFALEDDVFIQTLELHGFMVSCEIQDRILFVLKGKNADHFCIYPGRHNSAACA